MGNMRLRSAATAMKTFLIQFRSPLALSRFARGALQRARWQAANTLAIAATVAVSATFVLVGRSVLAPSTAPPLPQLGFGNSATAIEATPTQGSRQPASPRPSRPARPGVTAFAATRASGGPSAPSQATAPASASAGGAPA